MDVTGAGGEEIHTDDQGRLKARFRWDRLSAADDPRALIALCELEAQTQAPSLAETRQKIGTRFGKNASALLGRCRPTP